MKLTIDRRKWLRGEGSDVSRLLRPSDGKMCCVGFYCLALGLNESEIVDRHWPRNYELPESAIWLTHNPGLSDANDSRYTDGRSRESRIAAIFAKNGVEVTFEN